MMFVREYLLITDLGASGLYLRASRTQAFGSPTTVTT
jgi:hypothetical protein